MKLNKLFPKKKIDEIFTKYGFNRLKSLDGITYKNKYEITVAIYRSRFEKGFFFLDHSALTAYGLKIDGYKREWQDEEVQECISFIEAKLLPKIFNLKGPYKMAPDHFFKKVEELFSSYVKVICEKGNKDFDIPVDNNEVVKFNYDYLKFIIDEGKILFFLKSSKIYRILLHENKTDKKLYAWYNFADRDKEGDELVVQMVENIAVFLKLKE